MKRNIRACRIVLANGYVVMDYIDNNCMRGIAFAGIKSHDYKNLLNCTQDEFEKSIKDWANKNKDNENVEYIEFI